MLWRRKGNQSLTQSVHPRPLPPCHLKSLLGKYVAKHVNVDAVEHILYHRLDRYGQVVHADAPFAARSCVKQRGLRFLARPAAYAAGTTTERASNRTKTGRLGSCQDLNPTYPDILTHCSTLRSFLNGASRSMHIPTIDHESIVLNSGIVDTSPYLDADDRCAQDLLVVPELHRKNTIGGAVR